MSAVKRFSVDSFKSEFGNKYKIEFYCFFMTSNIWNILDMDKVCEIRANTPFASLFESLASKWSFIGRDTHLGFLEGSGPNYEMGAHVQATRCKLQILYRSKKAASITPYIS